MGQSHQTLCLCRFECVCVCVWVVLYVQCMVGVAQQFCYRYIYIYIYIYIFGIVSCMFWQSRFCLTYLYACMSMHARVIYTRAWMYIYICAFVI
jgi:hypothetical protein